MHSPTTRSSRRRLTVLLATMALVLTACPVAEELEDADVEPVDPEDPPDPTPEEPFEDEPADEEQGDTATVAGEHGALTAMVVRLAAS